MCDRLNTIAGRPAAGIDVRITIFISRKTKIGMYDRLNKSFAPILQGKKPNRIRATNLTQLLSLRCDCHDRKSKIGYLMDFIFWVEK